MMINSIQYLRGIAALLVVFFHANASVITKYSPDHTNYFFWGSGGVDLFFIISGFIMVYITYGKSVSVKEFAIKRIIRIYPVFWIYVSIALVIFLIKPDMVNRSSVYPTLILPSYLLIPYVEFTNLLLVAWSLIYEIHFYLLFSVSLIFLNKNRYIFCGLGLSIAAISSLFEPHAYYLNYIMNPIVLEFLLGMIAYFIIFKRNDKFALYSLLFLFAASCLVLLVNDRLPSGVLYYGIPSFLIIVISLYMESKGWIGMKNNIFSSFMMMLGNSSYSLYLSHIFVIGVIGLVSNKLGLFDYFNANLLVFVMVIGSVIWGWVSFKVIETPLTNILNRMFVDNKKKKHRVIKDVTESA